MKIAGLGASDSRYHSSPAQAIKGEVDAAFFLAEAHASLSRMTRSQLKVLVESAIHDISHVVIAHPRIQDQVPAISAALFAIGGDTAGRDILDALGLPGGFEPMSQEDAEFMIDLMDTLLD